MDRTIEVVEALYAAYDSEDLDALLAGVSDDVDWPDGASRLQGRDAVRRYWSEQWTRTATHDIPDPIVEAAPGVVAVGIRQVVRDRDGHELSTGRFVHVLHLRDGLATRLDILPIHEESL